MGIKDKLVEIATAAGIVMLLTTSDAAAQSQQTNNLITIKADSISITTSDGRVVFNQAAGAGTATPSSPAQAAAPTGRRRAATDTTTPTPPPSTEAQTSTRRSRTTTQPAQATGTTISSVEDCVTVSRDFVRNATAQESKEAFLRQALPGTSRGSTNATPAAGQSYMATCFNTVDGKEVPVAKITFSGTNTPVVELIPLEPGK